MALVIFGIQCGPTVNGRVAGIRLGGILIPVYQIVRVPNAMKPCEIFDGYRSLTLLQQSEWLGGNGMQFAERVFDYKGHFAISYLITSYGILAGVLVSVAVTALIIKILRVSLKQKNQLGTMIGLGCGMIFFLNILLNLYSNVSGVPFSYAFFPFLSDGKSNLLLSYILMGLVMSIYRYKNILPVHCDRKVRIKKISS